jgi:hypothetical protein
MAQVLLPLQHPFTMIVSGPTSSGKTFLVRKLLANYRQSTTFNQTSMGPRDRPVRVMWAYGQTQALFSTPIPGTDIKYYEGILSDNDLASYGSGAQRNPDVIVIDDLMRESVNNGQIANLFTRGSHHRNISVIFIIQNLFVQGREMRNMAVNAHYYLLMKNKRDKQQIMTLGRQVYPRKDKFFAWAVAKATSRPFSYILIDLHPRIHDNYIMRSNIFPDDAVKGSPVIYLPR